MKKILYILTVLFLIINVFAEETKEFPLFQRPFLNIKQLTNKIHLINSGSTKLQAGSIKDIDGNKYGTIIIGKQIWMTENLKVTKFRDGTQIPLIQEANQWSQLSSEAYCLDKNDPQGFKRDYGVLYNFSTVNDPRGLAPKGWHVPSKKEWDELINYLGGFDKAGGFLKDVDSKLWQVNHTGAVNKFGFSARPAGGRGKKGDIGEIGLYATWWSSTSSDQLYAWHFGLYPDKNKIRFNPGHKSSGFSVRCIKN